MELVEFPASADEQRTQFVQRQEAKAGDCDVFRSDMIWTAEFASQGWLYDLTPYIEETRDEFVRASIDTATYEGKIWGVPHLHQRGASSTTARTGSRRLPRRGRRSTSRPETTAGSSFRARPTRA